MYLPIRISPEDRPKFRFLWRKLEVDQIPDVYEFERVVFDHASPSFRAQYVSKENARIHRDEIPLPLMKSTYMDDSLDSLRNNDSGVQLFQDVQGLWGKDGMKARKWLSNSPEVRAATAKEHRAFEIDLDNSSSATKTFGIFWRTQQYVFSFQVKTTTEKANATKRFILSKVARVCSIHWVSRVPSMYARRFSFKTFGQRSLVETNPLTVSFRIAQETGSQS